MGNVFFVVNIGNQIHPNSRDSFVDAANRWDCTYVEITEDNLEPAMPPQFTKLKAFRLREADRIFCIDADTIIRADTPNPFVEFQSGIFRAVANKQPHMGIYIDMGAQIEQHEFQKMYKAGFPKIDFNFDIFLNSGVWLADRVTHSGILDRALEIGQVTGNLHWWDQAALNYALAEAGAKIHVLYSNWNHCLPSFGQWHTMQKYIYHFAGMPDRLQIIPQIDWRKVA